MKYYFFTFALGLLLGLFLSFMYSTAGKLPVQVAKATAPKQLQAQVFKNEYLFIKKADSFQRKSVQLQQELILTKNELKTAKEKNASLHVAIYKLLDKEADKPLEHSSEIDCDSLVVLVDDLMQTSVIKDSLYDDTVINLEQQVSNKDSTISVKERQYTELKAAFNMSIEGQKQLTTENKLLTKDIKKQKRKSKIISAALLILSGAAANYLIQH
jgi:hypothetical protein